ncbi:MAG TPA: PAS domain S-box protein [Pseudolabrys sp.]|nr:PAS domain S-box protein [Pseudolabrys sp.]
MEEAAGQERRPAARQAAQIALYAARIAAVVAAYAVLAEIALAINWVNPVAAPLWPPTGLAIGVLLVFGVEFWPGVVLGAYASAAIAGLPPTVCAFAGAGSLCAGLGGSYLVRTLALGNKGFSTPLGVIRVACFGIVPAAAIGTLAAAAGFAAAETDLASYAAVWPVWWLADAAFSLLVAPLIIAWGTAPFDRNVALEAAVAALLAFVIGFIAFSPAADIYLAASDVVVAHRWLLGFVALMPLIGAALREDQRVSSAAIFALIAAAAWGSKTVAVLNEPVNDRLLMLFALSVSVSLAALVLTAGFALRRDMHRRLTAARDRVAGELEQTQTALDLARHHFQALVDDVADHAVFVLDTAGRVASWNNSAQRITGYAQEEVLGKPFGLFYRPDERRAGEAVRALEQAIQKGKHDVEGWRIRKDGTPFFITGVVSVIRGQSGDLIGFSSIMRDTTERRDTQEKLVEAREQLVMAQKMEAIGKLTGGIAHDFNNLLMIIGGNAQAFKRLLDPKLPRAIEAIQTAAKRGETLTRQLLTFSRSQHVSPSVIDLAAVIRNLRPMIESSLRGNIVYKEAIAATAIFTKADLAELELAIVNIAVNARDAMPSGGTFTLSLSEVTSPVDAQGSHLEGAFAAVRFGDTGAGIPPNLLSKIFDPFFTTKEVGKGTGLGLSQVYGFVHQAGGTIKVDSKVGEGTTFTVYLPVCAERETIAVPGANRVDSHRPRVLVVDDNPDVAQVTSSLFEQMGYDTSLRDSAESALQFLAQGKRADLVFSDIVMPGSIDGIGLANEIRVRYPSLPVILSTGYTDSAQKVPDGLHVLRKPFDTDTLTRVVEIVLRPGEAPARRH